MRNRSHDNSRPLSLNRRLSEHRGYIAPPLWAVTALALTGCADAGVAPEPTAEARAALTSGLAAEYFDNKDLTNLKLTRTDPNIDFNWGSGAPDPSVGGDTFSVRWSGKITPAYSQVYTFYTYTYDGARLWVNGQLLIDDWAWDEGEESATIALTAGQSYDIKLEHFEDSGAAVARLSWSSQSQPKQVIPASAFSSGSGSSCGAPKEPLPVPASSPEVLIRNDFEQESASCWASRPSTGCGPFKGIKGPAAIVSDQERRSGRNSLRLTFGNNEDEAGGYLNPNATHVFYRYYDYYAPDFDFAGGMKIARFSGHDSAAGINQYDIILVSRAAQTANGDYCGTNPMQQLFLQRNGGSSWQFVNQSFTRGRWIPVETEILLNTPGQADGEVRVFVDGAPVIEKTGLNNVRDAGDNLPINSLFVGGWFSNSGNNIASCYAPNPASRRSIDDLVVSTRYVGPEPTLSNGSSCAEKVVSFTTPQPGTTQVEYGTTASYGSTTTLDGTQVTNHQQAISGLSSGKGYHYRVKSTWSNGYQYVSPDYTFVAD